MTVNTSYSVLIRSSHRESLHIWRTFTIAYNAHGSPDHKFRYQLAIKSPTLPLTEYYKGLTSPSLSFMTCLRVSPRAISVPDLVQVSTIPNLALLDLTNSHLIEPDVTHFDERLMRSWAALARSRNSFRHLRVLMVAFQESLGSWLFKYLDAFPSMCHVIVTDCRNINQKNKSEWNEEAVRYGWEARHGKRSAKTLKPLLDDGMGQFYVGSTTGVYYHSQELFEQLCASGKPEVLGRLPVLECLLGSPKVWTHILDEFPGTRTVWFDNVKTREWAAERSKQGQEQEKRLRDVVGDLGETRSPPSKRGPRRWGVRSGAQDAVSLLSDLGWTGGNST